PSSSLTSLSDFFCCVLLSFFQADSPPGAFALAYLLRFRLHLLRLRLRLTYLLRLRLRLTSLGLGLPHENFFAFASCHFRMPIFSHSPPATSPPSTSPSEPSSLGNLLRLILTPHTHR